MIRPALLLAAALALAGCKDDQAGVPPAVAMTPEALGHYCQMALTEHDGPKAQIHLKDALAPLFFSQVRDAIAYQHMPEQDGQILVIYVSDMGAAESWAKPGVDNWIDARNAFFVLGSDAIGGMGAAELVPFGSRAGAEAFAKARGGRVARLDEIRNEDVLAPDSDAPDTDGDSDYLERLNALKPEGSP
ncbi:MAG TPA: copper resistance protein CopZ [Rhodobacteraceae bacterium]|nr:copper resistance protein CopZ [Paracoccaceae bacterium]